jgi:MFS family permease
LRAAGKGSRPIYYGWWVLAASAFAEMLTIGSISYGAGLFVLPLQQELSLSRAAANSALPIAFAGGAMMAPLVGYLLDRYPVQWVVSLGALALGLGFAAISLTSSLLLMVFALLILVGFGGMAIGPLTTSTLTSRWFYRRRGRALGIATVATSGGGILVVPLLGWAIEAYGWRTALRIESVLIILIVLVLSMFVIRGGPAQFKLEAHPENEGRPRTDIPFARWKRARSEASHWRYGAILSSANFWAVGLTLAAITGIAQALIVTLVPYGTELGYSSAAAVFLISAFSVTAAGVKILSGFAAEFVDRRTIMLAATLAMTTALSLLLTFSGYAAVLPACCLAGVALGCILPSTAALIAACFGAPSFGRVMGMIYVAVVLASVCSVRFIGAIYDGTGGYGAAFLSFLGIAVMSSLAVLLIRTPQTQGPTEKDQAAEADPSNIVVNAAPR